MILQKQYIRKILSAIICLVFAFGITPKITLHNLFANHKDTKSIWSDHHSQLTTSGFHCNIDNLVVEAPFLFENKTIELKAPRQVATIFVQRSYIYISPSVFYYSLRGPPNIAG